MECGVYGDLVLILDHSIFHLLKGTLGIRVKGIVFRDLGVTV